jgi:hypothetical protein
VLAPPLITTLSVLANDDSKAHTCASIAIVAGYAKSQHFLAKFVTRRRPFWAGADFNPTRTNTKGLSKNLAAHSDQQN